MTGSVFGAEERLRSLGVPVHQENLAYPFESLEPWLNGAMLKRHYEEHHAAYVKELQTLVQNEGLEVGNVVSLMPGMDRLVQPARNDSRIPLGRLASQGLSFEPPRKFSPETVQKIRQAGGGHVNHTAFWRYLAPAGSGPKGPQEETARAIQDDFGSIKAFRQAFKEAALSRTGSGWAWLVYRPDKCLVVSSTPNEDNPLMKDHVAWEKSGRPILCLDLWEHAYAEQFGEDREQYIDAWWKVVNWDFVGRAYRIVSGLPL